ncbi:flagellar basal body rod protein FlgB [Clostridium fallax]|uniref:Flagellar basal body rod protein FlgB n=1 Tax=Clostridium fallax TaxID=1533 RepID=A0A1M4UK85_9CLOT|nr:flagellar basal body rod protein FlgB [Clostridium fallax]SHE57084.1 flagellar basal-body rod protein FlgB [Clostridium fallax]SQB07610.1 flagellar basal-body rod protein FlgB [Clostridium fallax]
MSLVRMDSDGYSYNLIKRALDVSTLRGKVISNNMANINTKGYKRFTVSFENTLKAMDEQISKNGFDLEKGLGEIKIEKDKSTSMKADGNNVDLDIEKTNQAANTLMYNALITQANNKLSMTKCVINGGGR